jgi:DNA-binding XRE family transcriptional regulator
MIASMTKTRPFSELADKVRADPVRRQEIETYKRAMRDVLALAELRARQDVTQLQMAETLGVSQANISRIEHEEDLYLSTLRGYVEALSGKLEVNVVFPDATVTVIAAER